MEVCLPAQCQASHRRFRDPLLLGAWGATVSFSRKACSLGPSLHGPRGARPPALASSLSPRRDLGAIALCSPTPAAVRRARAWACSERADPEAGGGGGGGGSGCRCRRCALAARAELRSLLAAAPGQPARSRAHKLPAAERRAASSCSKPPSPTPRPWPALDAHPWDTHPRCKADRAAPRPQAHPRSLASVSSAKPHGWKMWQPATERLQVSGTGAARGQPGGGGDGPEEPSWRLCPLAGICPKYHV